MRGRNSKGWSSSTDRDKIPPKEPFPFPSRWLRLRHLERPRRPRGARRPPAGKGTRFQELLTVEAGLWTGPGSWESILCLLRMEARPSNPDPIPGSLPSERATIP